MQANKKSVPFLIKTGMMLTESGDLCPNCHGPIQYGLILKILDMFLDWNNRRWLENIHH